MLNAVCLKFVPQDQQFGICIDVFLPLQDAIRFKSSELHYYIYRSLFIIH